LDTSFCDDQVSTKAGQVQGRFLSVDPRVRDSAASQSWNGYGYVEARLLSATDPSGWATVDCPQCVVPIEPIVPTVTVTAPRLYPLGTIADFMAMWGGVDTSLQPSRPANEDAEREETQDNQSEVECPGSSLNAGASFGAYAGPGAEFKGGNDLGNKFGTVRVGFGIGGGGSIDRAPLIPGPEFDRNKPGWVMSVTYDFAVSWFVLDFSLSAGAARNLTSGESSPVFSPGVSGGAGTRIQISLGAEITHYRARESSPGAASCSNRGH
jgi:hypothetical protein